MSQYCTIPQMFLAQAQRYGERRLFLAKREGVYREIRWSEVRAAVEEFAAALLASGVQPQDRVAILSENRPEWAIADLAIQMIRGVTVPIYATDTSAEVGYILANAHAVAVVVSTEEQRIKVHQQRASLPQLKHIIICEPQPLQQGDIMQTFAEVLQQGRAARAEHATALAQRLVAGSAGDTATIIYTSGTTGEPKGVMLSHSNFLSNCAASSEALDVNEHDVHLSFLPLSHVFERMAGWYLMLRQGATIAYAEEMDRVPANILDIQPTLLMGVPRFFEKLYSRVHETIERASPVRRAVFRWAMRVGADYEQRQQARQCAPLALRLQHCVADRLVFHPLKQHLGGRIRFCVSGGAPLSREIAEFFGAAGLLILEGYGLTETSPVITVNRIQAHRFGSVGKVLDGVEVRIADDGEIVTRGPHIMQGYHDKPDETAAVLREGWFYTGDIGHVDEDGFLHITDRKKDLIKTAGGKMVAPQKIENLLVMDPYIMQAFVFGDRQRFLVALVVPQFDLLRQYARQHGLVAEPVTMLVKHAKIRELIYRCIQQRCVSLAAYEQIKYCALLDHECTQATGELTPTLKARRSILAQKYSSTLDDLYNTQFRRATAT